MCKCVWVRGEGGQFIKIAWNRFSYKAIFFFVLYPRSCWKRWSASWHCAWRATKNTPPCCWAWLSKLRNRKLLITSARSARWDYLTCPIKSKLRPIHGHAWLLSVSVGQSWSQVIRQTEALGRVMRSHADDLNSGPLHRLATLIRDKQQVKKSYQSLHQQLESHNHKVCWENKNCANLTVLLSQWPCLFFSQVTRSELDKLKATYRQLSREANNAKEKYREALAKGSCCSFTPQKTVTLRCFCSLLLLPFPTSSSNHRKGGRASPRALRQSDGKAPQPS